MLRGRLSVGRNRQASAPPASTGSATATPTCSQHSVTGCNSVSAPARNKIGNRVVRPLATSAALLCWAAATSAATPGSDTLERAVARAARATSNVRGSRFAVPESAVAPAPVAATGSASLRRSLDGPHPLAQRDDRPSLPPDATAEPRASAALEVHWQSGPTWERSVRDYRRNGVPIAQLSAHARVAIGVSKHGVPGVYLTQKMTH